ncbi:uncharacterized protein LOC110849280 isoform X2 [Folsomia candida]|uniref:uncharacterized protein LOC110849280 isoform X2 n=1 Tax=Folsomia candida TaxID=158441 RepID=UPI000B9041A5|nr:uncharacterized protein LOC110849280 isoform X2 [Folsomia candida]
MKLLIFVTFIVGAFGQYLPPLTGKVPLSTYPGQGNYYPYQNQYPYQYGYPYNQYQYNQYPGVVVPPPLPVKTVPEPVVPVVDVIQPTSYVPTGSVSPLEAALSHIDHKKNGHSEKYYYGRHNLGPTNERPSPPSSRARHSTPLIEAYPGGSLYNYPSGTYLPGGGNYPMDFPPGVNYEYQYPLNYQYPNQHQQYVVPTTTAYPPVVQQQYYNSYYPTKVGELPIPPYIGMKKPVVVADEVITPVAEVGHTGHTGHAKKPFTVEKKPHYEVYLYE